MIIREYEDPDSPAFGKTASTVRRVVMKKNPMHKKITNKLVQTTLESVSSTYSRTRKVNKNKFFHSTGFYSTHPHYRWHVDLQDMTIFRKSFDIAKKDTYNFMLICVDDFSNYLMVDLIKDKCTTTVLNSMIKIIQRKGHILNIVDCDQGSKFKNKLFDNPKTNGFQVQFTIDRRKAVYAEQAI